MLNLYAIWSKAEVFNDLHNLSTYLSTGLFTVLWMMQAGCDAFHPKKMTNSIFFVFSLCHYQ